MHLQRMLEDGNVLSNEVANQSFWIWILLFTNAKVAFQSTCLMWKPTKNDLKTNDMTEVRGWTMKWYAWNWWRQWLNKIPLSFMILRHAHEHTNTCSLLMIWLWIFTIYGCFFMFNVQLICEDYTSDELFGREQWKRLSQVSKLPRVEPQSMGTWTRLATLYSVWGSSPWLQQQLWGSCAPPQNLQGAPASALHALPWWPSLLPWFSNQKGRIEHGRRRGCILPTYICILLLLAYKFKRRNTLWRWSLDYIGFFVLPRLCGVQLRLYF